MAANSRPSPSPPGSISRTRAVPTVFPIWNPAAVSWPSTNTAEAYRFLGERFPALANAPLTESRVCQYESTANGDFLIDRHPGYENVWLAGGGSGHGFKHGPAVGEYLAARILKGTEPEPRFSLASKDQAEHRTVY